MPRAILFDVDGTLLDTVDRHAEAWRAAFARFGKDVPLDDLRGQIGKGGDQLVPVFLTAAEVERIGGPVQEAHGEIYRREHLPRIRAFPGAREVLARAKGEGTRVVLASSAKRHEVEYAIRLLDAAALLDGVTSADDVDRTKPFPDIFEAALAKARGVARGEAVVVGDSPWDAEGARRAGIAAVGVLCGGFAERDLRAAGCAAVYGDPEDLLARWASSPLAAR